MKHAVLESNRHMLKTTVITFSLLTHTHTHIHTHTYTQHNKPFDSTFT